MSMSTSCARARASLDDLVDGILDGERAASVEAHAAGCDSCGRELAGLRELRRRAGQLGRSIDPPRDLWPEIAAAVERRRVVRERFGGERRALLVAAAAAVVVAVAVGYFAGRQASPPEVVDVGPPSALRQARLGVDSLAEARVGLERARDQAEMAFAARRDDLPPETVRVIDSNLRVIEQAIAEISAALEEEPDNARLALRLASVYRRQIELLERATRLPDET